MTEVAKTELEIAREKLDESAKAANSARTGKGTRVKVGSTRGKNPQAISYEAFDESLPETLPKSLGEFMELTKINDEAAITGLLIDGYNDSQYTAASDPIAEYVNPAWSDDVQKQFRMVVRNYVAALQGTVSIEDAVALIKPGIEKAQASVKTASA